ncbi:MAG: hypothetical protein PHV34_20230 [Verrucomicrobiae bacterium]|nr:hypothetical protein [Verrucomicrobiae bacterium]
MVNSAEVSDQQLLKHQYRSREALRCEILRGHLGQTCRGLAMDLAHSALYQWFCHLGRVDQARIPGKSSLNEYSRWLSAGQMRQVINRLAQASADPEIAIRKLGLIEEMDLQEVWVGTICVKSNIHFPVEVKWSVNPGMQDARHLLAFLEEHPKSAANAIA